MFLLPPLVLLRRLTRHPDAGPAAYAALAVGAAFAGFALTDNVFDRQLTVIAFYFLMSWLLAAAAVQRSLPARVPSSPATPAAMPGVAPAAAPPDTLAPSAPSTATAAAIPSRPGVTAVGLSVAIIAKNEAHRIAACLASVAFADQCRRRLGQHR